MKNAYLQSSQRQVQHWRQQLIISVTVVTEAIGEFVMFLPVAHAMFSHWSVAAELGGRGGNCPSNLRINNCEEILEERYLNFRTRV